ncbi:MAG: septum formation protein Maf [Clostridiales bacterium]|nr:septum formation protein Maf [Clostridiales bacterium]
MSRQLILGSASPRRRELLSLITEDFTIKLADIDERALETDLETRNVPAIEVSEELASAKAHAVFEMLDQDSRASSVVIGADTSVILDDVIYGKPESKEDAKRMLTNLSGRKHVVATGVSLVFEGGEKRFTDVSLVEFYPLDDYQKNVIERYIESGDPMDKAGAYGIQTGGALLVRGIEGDFLNVVGLPVARLARELSSVIF